MLSQILIISFIVWAIWATLQEGMIFGWLAEALSFMPSWFRKPVFECIICMTFWHGIIAYQLLYDNDLKKCLTVVIASMGFNTIISYIAHNATNSD